MSELGPLAFGRKEQEVFLGRDFTQQQEYSQKTAIEIDEQVRKIVGGNYDRAKKILQDNMDALHRLAQALLEFESLDVDQIDAAIRGDKVESSRRNNPPASTPPTAPATAKSGREKEAPIFHNPPLPEPGKA